jgi:hypothetical protein
MPLKRVRPFIIEGVTSPTNSPDGIRLTRDIERLAERRHVNIDSSLRNEYALRPNGLEYFKSRKHVRRREHEKAQQSHMQGRQMQQTPALPNSVRLPIQFNVREAEAVGFIIPG